MLPSGDQDKFNILLKIADQQNFKIDFNAEGKLHSTIHYAVLGGNAGIIKTLIALDVGITTNDVKASKSNTAHFLDVKFDEDVIDPKISQYKV